MVMSRETTTAAFTAAQLQQARLLLLQVVEGGGKQNDDEQAALHSISPLVQLLARSEFSGLSLTKQRLLLLASVTAFSKTDCRRFYAGLHPKVGHVLQTSFGDDDDDEEASLELSRENYLALIFVTDCIMASIDALEQQKGKNSKQLDVASELLDVATELHHVLLDLMPLEHFDEFATERKMLRLKIVGICERYWHVNGVAREVLLPQCLPLLVVAVVEGDADNTKNDGVASIAPATTAAAAMKRLCKMREAFQWIDFTDESAATLQHWMLRLVSHPACVHAPDGRKFLAYMFQLELRADVHQAIKNQIPTASKSVLQAYGEVYLKAWKDTADNSDDAGVVETNEFVESHVLADLVYAVLHIEKQSMQRNLLAVLRPFHDAQKSPAVEALLHRLYAPVLFRACSATHPGVRRNAVQVLSLVFPLQDPSHTQTQQAIAKAVDVLRTLLMDQVPAVRCAAAQAAADILGLYWDVLTAATIRQVLDILVAQHASDASAAVVRASAVRAVTQLLQHNQVASQAVLRPLLPALGNLIHDRVMSVRLAVVDMLRCIKTIKGIKYYHVVPPTHLTAQLAEEGRLGLNDKPVAKGLTVLMLNSYVPQGDNVSGLDQLKRTIKFLQTDPAAARVFYANLGACLDAHQTARFAGRLWMALQAAVDQCLSRAQQHAVNTTKRRCFGKPNEDDRNDNDGSSDQTSLISVNDTALVAEIAETICTLLSTTAESTKKKKEHAGHDAFIGKDIVKVLMFFERKATSEGCDEATRSNYTGVCSSLLRSAGRLPADQVQELVQYSLAVLSTCRQDTFSPSAVAPHVALLCLLDRTDDVALALGNAIESALNDDGMQYMQTNAMARGMRRSGRAKFKSDDNNMPVLPSSVALDLLEALLRGVDPSAAAARACLLQNDSASATISGALETGIKYAEHLLMGNQAMLDSLDDAGVEYVIRVCELYGRYVLHRAGNSDKNVQFGAEAERLLHWSTEKVVRTLLPKSDAEDRRRESAMTFDDPDLSRISLNESALPSSPQRRGRIDRTKTPVKSTGLTSLASPERVHLSLGFARSFAISLLQSACILFSEWLAVGGNGTDAIMRYAVEWCAIFSQGEIDIAELIPAFARLAVQLCKRECFALQKELIVASSNASYDMSTMKAALQTLFGGQRLISTSTVVQGTVRSVVDAVRVVILRDNIVFSAGGDIGSIADIWPADSPVILSAIEAIAANRLAGLETAQLVLERFAENSTSQSVAAFDARLLAALCKSDGSKGAEDVLKLVRRFDLERVNKEHGAGALLRDALVDVLP